MKFLLFHPFIETSICIFHFQVPWSENKDYFAASFVKLVESSGGRAVPVLEVIYFSLIQLRVRLGIFWLDGFLLEFLKFSKIAVSVS